MRDARISLLFIVNSLGFGGAEKHVVSIVNRLDIGRFRMSLAYLKDDAALLPQIARQRLEGGLLCCNVRRRIDRRVVNDLARHIEAEQVDIVVCVNTYSLLYGQLARAAAGSRALLVDLFHSTELCGMKERLQMWFYRPFIRFTDMLVYVCDAQRRYWRRRMLRARSDAVVHNGVDVAWFADRFSAEEHACLRRAYGLTPDDYVVGLCAAMRPEKAHADLLRAAARLRSRNVPMKCLLIGDGPERSMVERQVSALSLDGNVVITGFLQDVRPAIAVCDVMVIVSHHVETFSLAALEAMAMGKPMIMSNISGAAEQVTHGENGYLYPRGDIDALAGAMQALASRPAARRMGKQARMRIERHFSIDVMIDAYEQLFGELMQVRHTGKAQPDVA